MPSTATTHPYQENASSPIHPTNNEDPQSKNPESPQNFEENSKNSGNIEENSEINGESSRKDVVVRRERPSRACTQRAGQRLQQAAVAEAALAAKEKKRKVAKRKERLTRLLKEEYVREGEEDEEEEEEDNRSSGGDKEEVEQSLSTLRQQCGSSSKVITPLVAEPETSQLPRWNIRSMWQLASILNFFHVFRPLLNIKVEFSAEEFETALITPNNTLGEIHMPLLKAIPPVTRVALGNNTWITVLARKLKAWWHWVAEGELPIVASQGGEIEAYYALDPGVRVVILKALCDIRVEQEDIRNYIDDSIKHGVHLSTFRKDCIGGARGVSYWYEDDSVVGHRLYREIRKAEVKRGKGKNVPPIPNSAYQWETVGTNFEELKEVSEKLFSSKNRIEALLGKKLKSDMLPEVEKVQKRKEKLLKKQHREALLLESMVHLDGFPGGRSLRDRKPVTYTFDDYDRSINEAIIETKQKQISPDPTVSRDRVDHEVATNGRSNGSSTFSGRPSFRRHSPESPDYDESGDDHKFDTLDRSNRRRQRPQRYSVKDFVDGVSDNDGDTDTDDDVVGEIVYDDEYVKDKRRKVSSSSEGDEDYKWDDENPEDEEEEEEEEEYDDSLNSSEESDRPQKFKNLRGRSRRETKLRSVGERPSGLRRSERATKSRINYQQYEWSGSENESSEHEKSNESHEYSEEASENADFSMESHDSDGNHENMDMEVDQMAEEHPEMLKKEQEHPPETSHSPDQIEVEGVKQRRFLDLNELAPCSGFDDGPNSMKDEDTDNF